jgi:hypothetical protein
MDVVDILRSKVSRRFITYLKGWWLLHVIINLPLICEKNCWKNAPGYQLSNPRGLY